MSEENLPAIKEPETDLAPKDLELVQKYVDEGLPGVGLVDAKKLTTMLDLYLSGRTYRQISNIVSLPKQAVMYMSYKFNWFQLRREYLEDLEANIRPRVIEANLVNQDFILELQQMYQKKIGSNIRKYLATDNVEFANAIDLKEVDKYLKTVELLHRLSTDKPGKAGGTPAVGLNLGEGVTIVKKGDNEVEITPKSKALSEQLKQFANFKREEEKKK